jgi:hypothetical protein
VDRVDQYDLLIYSPSISSGVSFVRRALRLVAYLVNSRSRRVWDGPAAAVPRASLKDRGMYLRARHPPRREAACSMEEIETSCPRTSRSWQTW